ncbi:arginase [Paenibacillus radicis (ex Gao et al. 2016)]|uniref:Arginase n=1 Tax=Paenibacillus radicis (ex Gao et al. 2016) TaxID=1737354 RepID=A0A917HTW8_9BACL|nr:arginase [Paenibacillus radicis (ex Gao et al. 2016)]GGG88963.1 arginase [Paenibacillus radicis (ex Gao et al. 2016)]
MRDITLLSVPFGLGAGRAGSELGPAKLVGELDLAGSLRRHGLRIGDEKEIAVASLLKAMPPDAAGYAGKASGMKHAAEVLSVSRALAAEGAAAAAAGHFPLFIGGDHSMAIGSVAGLTARYEQMGIIWFDAHADLNTETTSFTGNMHGISLAAAIGLTTLSLKDVYRAAKPIALERAVLLGARDLDPAEERFIQQSGLTYFSKTDIGRLGIEETTRRALQIACKDADGLHLSFDIDSVDPGEAPGTGTPVPGGISILEVRLALRIIGSSALLSSADFVELNPLLDQGERTSKLMHSLIAELLLAHSS